MDRLLALWQNMTTEQLVVTLLIASNIGLWIKVGFLSAKYQLVNACLISHSWVIRLKLGVKTIKAHRSGDFELVQPIDEIEE
jgi:hypothetical protein